MGHYRPQHLGVEAMCCSEMVVGWRTVLWRIAGQKTRKQNRRHLSQVKKEAVEVQEGYMPALMVESFRQVLMAKLAVDEEVLRAARKQKRTEWFVEIRMGDVVVAADAAHFVDRQPVAEK